MGIDDSQTAPEGLANSATKDSGGPPEQPPAAGQLSGGKVGRYQVLSIVGTGGMGEVYSGHDPSLDRSVAIKRLHPADKGDEKRAWRLRTEAQMHGRLEHPNIVRVYDFVSQDGADHIVSEYVDGNSLRQVTDDGRAGYVRGLEIMLGVARGLAFAHDNGIIHRDLKTENVLIGRDDGVKITDFGISRSLTTVPAQSTAHKTEAGTLVGTFQSMSPEQSYGATVDARSDLFSLGIMIYEVFAGKSPFEGKSIYETLTNIRKKHQTPLRELVPEVPVELSELVDRLLSKDPEARPTHANLVVTTLERLLAEVTEPDAARDRQRRQQVAVIHLSASARGGERDMVAFHDLIRTTAQSHRALLVYAAGDEALMCFGYPEMHENNTQLAAELVSDLFARVSLEDAENKIVLRAAVDVGEVTVHETGATSLLLGAPVTGAMHLGRLTPPGEFLASSRAHPPLARFFRMEARNTSSDADVVKDTLCYAVVEQHSIENARTTFVGREHELGVLKRAWDAVSGQGQGRVVVLEGEAGIGKSRLVHRFMTDVSFKGRELLTRVTPNDRYTPFEPFRRMLGRLPELHDDAGDFGREEIERHVRPTSPSDDVLVASIAHICDVAEAEDEALLATLEEKEGAGGLASKLALFLLGLAELHPLLVVVEDLHWIDSSSRQVIAELVAHAHRLPLLLVVTHRPEHEPAWAADRSVTRLTLERLTEEEAMRIVADCVGDRELDPALARALLDRALGVPLWLEELASGMVDRIARGASDLNTSAVPATLRDSVQNRLHRAGPETRATAELLAAIGREAAPDLLFAVSGRDRNARAADIDALKQRGLILQRGLLRNPLLVFRHALMRDAIYNGVEAERKQELHASVVTALTTHFPTWETERPELFAHHHEKAGLYLEAIRHWHQAGGHAAKLWSHDVACTHFKHALSLLPKVEDEAARLPLERAIRQGYRRCLQIVEGLWASEIEANNLRLADIAEDEAPSVEDQWMGFLQGYLLCNMPAVEGCLAGLAARTDDDLAMYVHAVARGIAAVHLGRFTEARAALESAIEAREAVLPTILEDFAEHTVTVAPNAYLQWVHLITGDIDGVWAQQERMEAAFPVDSAIHLNALAFGAVLGGMLEDEERARPLIRRVVDEGEGVLAAGHVHVARFFSAYLDLRAVARAPLSSDAAALAASVGAMWQHFLGWHAGFLRASSPIYCALTADVCVDLHAHGDADEALQAAMAKQAQVAIDWGLDCLADAGAEELHGYYSADLYRATGRVADAVGDRKGAKVAFAEARRRCDRLAELGGVEPRWLRARVERDAIS